MSTRRKPVPGMYAHTYTADESSAIAHAAGLKAEQDLLRIKFRRLAELTPLQELSTPELNAIARMLAIVARIESIERTLLAAHGKGDATLLDSLAEMDPYDL